MLRDGFSLCQVRKKYPERHLTIDKKEKGEGLNLMPLLLLLLLRKWQIGGTKIQFSRPYIQDIVYGSLAILNHLNKSAATEATTEALENFYRKPFHADADQWTGTGEEEVSEAVRIEHCLHAQRMKFSHMSKKSDKKKQQQLQQRLPIYCYPKINHKSPLSHVLVAAYLPPVR